MSKQISAIVVFLLLLSAVPLFADGISSSYTASVAGGDSNTGTSTVSASLSTTTDISNGGISGTITTNEYAVAGPGGVGSSSSVVLIQPGVPSLASIGGSAQSSAIATFTDFIITGPTGSVSVPASLNLALNGTYATTPNIFSGLDNILISASSIIDLSVGGSVDGTGFSGTFNQASGVNGQGPTGMTSTATGILDGEVPAPNFTTSLTTLPVGTAFTVVLQMSTDAIAGYQAEATIGGDPGNAGTSIDIQSVSDYSDTLTFSSVGPVFNLPDGYTANSVSADVVNNQYVGGAVTATPEPTTGLLLGISLLILLLFWGRRVGSHAVRPCA